MKNTLRKMKIGFMRLPLVQHISHAFALNAWKKNPTGNPPSIIKQKMVMSMARKYNIRHLIETGTYLGDMVYAAKNSFDKIDSIELSAELYRNAVERFIKNKKIKIWNGDSAIILSEIIKNTDKPSLFWLDAHYSGGRTARSVLGDTPIEKELEIIFEKWNNGNVLLIDDARLFVGRDNYPTIDELRMFINKKSSSLDLKVIDDVIIIKEGSLHNSNENNN